MAPTERIGENLSSSPDRALCRRRLPARSTAPARPTSPAQRATSTRATTATAPRRHRHHRDRRDLRRPHAECQRFGGYPFEWAWGWRRSLDRRVQIGVYASTTGDRLRPGTTPGAEQPAPTARNIRAFLLPGVDPTLYYTIAVRPFRVVDPDVNAAGVTYGAWKKSGIAGENPIGPPARCPDRRCRGTINGTSAANVATWVRLCLQWPECGRHRRRQQGCRRPDPARSDQPSGLREPGGHVRADHQRRESYSAAGSRWPRRRGGRGAWQVPYQIEVTNPVQNTEHFDLYLILYKEHRRKLVRHLRFQQCSAYPTCGGPHRDRNVSTWPQTLRYPYPLRRTGGGGLDDRMGWRRPPATPR